MKKVSSAGGGKCGFTGEAPTDSRLAGDRRLPHPRPPMGEARGRGAGMPEMVQDGASPSPVSCADSRGPHRQPPRGRSAAATSPGGGGKRAGQPGHGDARGTCGEPSSARPLQRRRAKGHGAGDNPSVPVCALGHLPLHRGGKSDSPGHLPRGGSAAATSPDGGAGERTDCHDRCAHRSRNDMLWEAYRSRVRIERISLHNLELEKRTKTGCKMRTVYPACFLKKRFSRGIVL